MLRATKTAEESPQHTEPDRFAHAKKFSDELSNSRLRKSKTRWTAEKRAEKRRIIRLSRPWESSTGPKTQEGKHRAARNACPHRSDFERFIVGLMRVQESYRKIIEILYIKDWPDDPLVVRKPMLTLEKLLLKMRRDMAAAKMETPALDARILMRQGGNFSDVELITKAMCPLSEQVIENTLKLLDRRLRGEPVSRIVGEREFWGLSFKVTPDTLDPRADTETLVEAALARLRFMGNSTPRILDLGTGTGCIPIALLKELPEATAVAVDISAAAVAVARENAICHGVDNRVDFLCGSWFEPLKSDESFDLITANPPYIPESDIESLAIEVRNHDPRGALSGGADGLDAYKTILKDLKKHLACGGFALFEIGAGQEKDLARIAGESNMTREESYADLGGIVRVVEIRMGKSENIFDSPR